MNPKRTLNPDEIRELYVNQGWTLQELASHYGCGETTIRRRLDELRITTFNRGPRPKPDNSSPTWSPELAYAVGMITTDGNLSKDGRHLTVTSCDYQVLETVRQCLRLNVRITPQLRWVRIYYRLQWSDRSLYDWLVGIGLMPAKSHKLGSLKVPQEYFADFLRGVIDGDGTIQIYTDRSNTKKKEKYVYERLSVIIFSASRSFLEWLQRRIALSLFTTGAVIEKKHRVGRRPFWILKYAKHDSTLLLNWIYDLAPQPRLERKYQRAIGFLGPKNS